MSSKVGLLALALAAACSLAVGARLSPWVAVGVLGCAAVLCVAAAFRREQRKVDRILFEELDRVDDPISTPVQITNKTSRPPLPSLDDQPTEDLPKAS